MSATSRTPENVLNTDVKDSPSFSQATCASLHAPKAICEGQILRKMILIKHKHKHKRRTTCGTASSVSSHSWNPSHSSAGLGDVHLTTGEVKKGDLGDPNSSSASWITLIWVERVFTDIRVGFLVVGGWTLSELSLEITLSMLRRWCSETRIDDSTGDMDRELQSWNSGQGSCQLTSRYPRNVNPVASVML